MAAPAAHKEASKIRNIPLDKLLPSTRNVRRVKDAAADAQLAAEARGVLPNLVVVLYASPGVCSAVEAGHMRPAPARASS